MVGLSSNRRFVIPSSEAQSMAQSSNLSLLSLLPTLVPSSQPLARPPISNYHVAAVGLSSDGRIFVGVNLEFPGLPLHHSVHAEQFLVTSLSNHGASLLALAVSAAPCGHCRQFLQELRSASELKICVTSSSEEEDRFVPLVSMLPSPFGPFDLLDSRAPLLLEPKHNRLSLISSVGVNSTTVGSSAGQVDNHLLKLSTNALEKFRIDESVATVDSITGLINRQLFISTLDDAENALVGPKTSYDKNGSIVDSRSSVSCPNNLEKAVGPFDNGTITTVNSNGVHFSNGNEKPTATAFDSKTSATVASTASSCNGHCESNDYSRLEIAALEAANRSHAPYSNCPSGIALMDCEGNIYKGSYMESAAYNPSLGPVQAAIVAYVASGGGEYDRFVSGVLVERESAVVRQEDTSKLLLKLIAPKCEVRVIHCTCT